MIYIKEGLPVYKVNKNIDGTNLTFDDGCNIIYVNGSYRADDAIGHLMQDFSTADANQMYYGKIAETVRKHKQEEQGAKTMCKIFEEYGDEVRAERNEEVVEDLLRQNKLTEEEISSVAKVPLEQVRQIAQRLMVMA